MDNFNSKWKEIINLPGELHEEETMICDSCHQVFPAKECVWIEDIHMFCPQCAATLEAMWEAAWEARHEDEGPEET
jgi:formylmethanofuran dehydrogenase subunit E